MANRYFRSNVLTQEVRQIVIAGKISLNASAAVTSNDLPLVASVTKTGTGTYRITLQDKYVSLKCAVVTPLSTEDVTVRIKAHDVSSAKTIDIETLTAGVLADVTATAELHVLLMMKDSEV